MASEIRVDKINSLSGVGTVTLSPTGVDIAGITTVATFKVGTGVTASSDGDIFATGVTTSTTFSGNFSGGTISGTTGTFSSTVEVSSGNLDIADSMRHVGDDNTKIRFPTADTVTVETGGTERFRITSDGKVSVNHSATSGMAPLSVKNSDDSNINVFEVYNDNGNRNGGFSQASDGDGSIFSTTDGGTIKVFFRTDNDSYLTGGNLGLGINNPTAASSETALHIYANEYPEVHLTSSVTGNAASDGSIFTLNNDSSTIIRNQENSYIRFDTNGSNERMRIHAGGTVNIPSGITLGSAISSTAAANTLDDYEYGNWSPAINSGGFSIDNVYYSKYVKVGKIVHLQYYVNLAGSGNSSALIFQGLPFAVATNGYATGTADFGKGSIKGTYSRTESNTSHLYFLYPSENTGTNRLILAGNQVGSGYAIGQITYYTDN